MLVAKSGVWVLLFFIISKASFGALDVLNPCLEKNNISALSLSDEKSFLDLQMQNCSNVSPKKLCKCAKKLDKFYAGADHQDFEKKKEDLLKERLIKLSELKLLSIIHDLNFTTQMLNLKSSEQNKVAESCNTKKLQKRLNSCLGNETSGKLFNELQKESLYLLKDKISFANDGFFKRDINKNTCDISDNHIYQINTYLGISTSHSQKDFDQSILGYYYNLNNHGKNIDVSNKNLGDINELKNLINDNQSIFVENFISNCSKTLENIEEALCEDKSKFKAFPSTTTFLNEFNISEQELSSPQFDSSKFLREQKEIYFYCVGNKKDEADRYLAMEDLLVHGEKERTDLYNAETIDRKDYKESLYSDLFSATRDTLCKEARPKLSFEEIVARGCSFTNFSKNISDVKDKKKNNCSYLVLDYILSSKVEELEKQNVDQNLIAYKKTIEENKKSNGNDLILDFLGVEAPRDIEVFKEAGIERKALASSGPESSSIVEINNKPQQNTTNLLPHKMIGQNAQEIARPYANYQNTQAYQEMSPAQKSQVSEVERELMRRLMGSKASESSSKARAEIYKDYSKQIMDLAKEKFRIENGSTRSEDLSSYERKIQNLVDEMREENKKIVDSKNKSPSDISSSPLPNEKIISSSENLSKASHSVLPVPSIKEEIDPKKGINEALAQTINRKYFGELEGAERNIASTELVSGFMLIENDKITDISDLEEVFTKKLKEKKPFVIAEKNNPAFKVKIILGEDNKMIITPLGDLNNSQYRIFYKKIEQSYQELQVYHFNELRNQFLEVQ